MTHHKHTPMVVFLLLLTIILIPGVTSGAEKDSSATPPVAEINQDNLDSTLARLSDEQVRSLLLAELSKDAANSKKEDRKASGLVYKARGWLRLLDTKETASDIKKESQSFLANVADDLVGIPKKLGGGSMGGFFVALLLLAFVFAAASLVEFFVRRFSAGFIKQFQEHGIPDLDGPMRFLAGVMRSTPAFINIFVYFAAALLVFLIFPFNEQSQIRYLFLATLFAIVFYRLLKEFSRILCAPKTPSLRVVPINDKGAEVLHRWVILLGTYLFIAVFSIALVMELEASRTTATVLVISASSLLIIMIIGAVFRSRSSVREFIIAQSEKNQTRNWAVDQFAQFWHIPTILYFILIWAILVNNQLSGIQQGNSAFLLSLLVVPLFVFFDTIGQWVIRTSISHLNIYNPDAEKDADEETLQKLAQAKKNERRISLTAGRVVRLTILIALLIWAASLWGYHIPRASGIAQAVFESLIAMALGLTAWRFASSYIEKKLAETAPEDEGDEEKSEDEFGGAVQRGRSYTLLPLLRKVVASILIIMVSLVILSSLGVNIGPLLAGAGVIGLAIGFGAQKLVSDVLSGFFYLLDDAFRVGEYIQAGPVSGAVESITLRNVMLRHHRGMLQIVPHSDLGSITNFMRGGIIVKFNLEFPYDADVEKIRKVIKKVGKKMLQDEEFGKDFIQPVKSAGVREITGSVMTIRVKFKAQPGTHFVIRREAYRRITEALNAQGIYYAHRKVIVELPEGESGDTPEAKKKALEAGAAAELSQLEEEKKAKTGKQGNNEPGMPGM